ncbi:MAG TPA: peptide chain release factor N(5)-glutamine methyltransferase [Bacteroidia bacterium]|nr:peptide chain release factor N(5)-glutamine methyltransferase [Bacteroidia bacterium]
MRIASNKIQDILAYFHKELSPRYTRVEIDRFALYCFTDFTHYSQSDILLNPKKTVNESALLKFHFAVKDLKRGRPIQHILGKAWFYGLDFIVSPDVLVPRPETEELVRLLISEAPVHNETFSVIDLGTGSGCIAVTLKKFLPRCHVYAVDISAAALDIARKNAEKHDCEIHFIQLDLLDASQQEKLPSCLFIISNPPYIKRSEQSALPANVLEFEPHLALFVPDERALIFYEAIAAAGKQKLKPGGKIYAEINETLGPETCIVFQKAGYNDVRLLQDMSGKDRFVTAS